MRAGIAVSNTSPLNYLILIDSVEILPTLFDRIVIPQTVARELAHENTPPVVRSWIENPPPLLEVLAPASPDLAIPLGSGERDALCLAQELEAGILLMDDRTARRVAQDRGLNVTGTLGLLDLADARGLLDLAKALEALLHTSFRIRADVVRSLLEARSQGGRRARVRSFVTLDVQADGNVLGIGLTVRGMMTCMSC